MSYAHRPREVGQAAYEAVASDINRRLGNPFLIPWEALSPEDRAAWTAAGHAEREAARAIPAPASSIQEALAPED